ncbi:MAG: TM2 domain-containing protein [Elainellaceae cyanobacterium]
MNNVSTSYLLWFCCLFGFAGLHRLYNGKIFTGLLWFCTWGLFGIGQLVDLLLIPSMVEDHNARAMLRRGMIPQNVLLYPQTSPPGGMSLSPVGKDDNSSLSRQKGPETTASQEDDLMRKLLKAAAKRGGKLTVTQGVMDTGHGFTEVETTLREMVKTGYIAAVNDPETGVVVYDFMEL